jgi:DNA-3-methyladenine glycosylase I
MPAEPSTVSLITDDHGVPRCWWCGNDPLYVDYHDHEWGRPVKDDTRLFEKICLEGFQAGLSWLTILRKRDAFRESFAGFAIDRVARMTDQDVDRLTQNAGIVRHRGKIRSTLNNARQATRIQSEFGSLANYVWQFSPKSHRAPRTRDEVPATSPESVEMSKDLKRRGWTFVGPTTCYAFMQSMGLVDDHVRGCHHRAAVTGGRQRHAPPRT